MSAILTSEHRPNAADLLALIQRLGDIEPRRVWTSPTPGTATEADLLRELDHGNHLCELVEATLVEKIMGAREGNLGAWISHLLYGFVAENNLGELYGSDSPFRLMRGLVRMPDIAFVCRDKLPGGHVPDDPISDLEPDLAGEVLSVGNTRGEMLLKREEYFRAGVALVWEVDPRRRVVTVSTAPDVDVEHSESDTLDGGSVLLGLQLPVRRVFERLPAAEPKKTRRRKKSAE